MKYHKKRDAIRYIHHSDYCEVCGLAWEYCQCKIGSKDWIEFLIGMGLLLAIGISLVVLIMKLLAWMGAI